MRIALVHDWLNNFGGAERVLFQLHKIFPDAPIYTLFFDRSFVKKFLPKADIRPGGLQKVPFIKKTYKFFFPFMPFCAESFDLSDYDTVVSSSVIFSKGLILKPGTRHICYCYSPTRPLWDYHAEYARQNSNKFITALSSHLLRIWDRGAADRVDEFAAISETVRARIKKYYRRDAKVIYPPLTIANNLETMAYGETFSSKQSAVVHSQLAISGNYFLIVSRLYPHKNIDIAIEAFNKLGYNLIILGAGPIRKKLEKMAGENIKFTGFQDEKTLINYYKNCKALIMPQEEDFGLTALEAMSFGKPVLALRKGGATEIIKESENGEFFDDPIPEALADGIRRLNENYQNYKPELLKQRAAYFSESKFKDELFSLINRSQ